MPGQILKIVDKHNSHKHLLFENEVELKRAHTEKALKGSQGQAFSGHNSTN